PDADRVHHRIPHIFSLPSHYVIGSALTSAPDERQPVLIEDISDVLIDGETRRVLHGATRTEGGDAVVAQSENRTGFDRPTEPLPAIVPRHDGELGLGV